MTSIIKNYFKTIKKIKNPFYFNSQKYVLDEISKNFKNKNKFMFNERSHWSTFNNSKLHNEINVKKDLKDLILTILKNWMQPEM